MYALPLALRRLRERMVSVSDHVFYENRRYLRRSNTSVMIVSSSMPAPAALGCCAPDFGNPYIASIVRRILTWVRPLPSAYASGLRPGLTWAPAKMVTIRFCRSSRCWRCSSVGGYAEPGLTDGLVRP